MTGPSMMKSRDELDDRLISDGRFGEVLAAYYPIIVAKLRMRMRRSRSGEVFDVAGNVCVRLLAEQRAGKRCSAPFRVVVHQVTKYVLQDHYLELKKHAPEVPTEPDAPLWGTVGGDDDGFDGVVQADWFDYAFHGLPPRDRAVADLCYRHSCSPAQIASELDITRNAVDQALHRVRAAVGKKIRDD